MRAIPLAVVFAIVTITAHSITAYACDPSEVPSRFELFDRADVVVIGNPTAVPDRAGDVELAVEHVLKGKPGKTVTVPLDGSTCDPGFRVGVRSLVFVKDGQIVGLYDGAIAVGKAPWLERMTEWSTAADDAARAAVAANAMSAGGELARDGVMLLVNKSAITRALSATQIATIAAAWPKLHSGLRGMLRALKHADLRKALADADRRERNAKKRRRRF